jgi:hypothetical protein
MYTFFAKLGVVTIIVAMLAVNQASVAAGPPQSAEGEILKSTNTAPLKQQYRVSDYHTRGHQNETSVQSHRTFSYQPASNISLTIGSRAMIASTGVKLMRGRDVIATLPNSQEVRILKVQGPWLGTSVKVDGVKKSGYVLASSVAPIAQSPRPSAETEGVDANRQLQPISSNQSLSRQSTRETYAARDCSPQQSTSRSHAYRGSIAVGSANNEFASPYGDLVDRFLQQ